MALSKVVGQVNECRELHIVDFLGMKRVKQVMVIQPAFVDLELTFLVSSWHSENKASEGGQSAPSAWVRSQGTKGRERRQGGRGGGGARRGWGKRYD